jgi:hypothetical protein
MNKETLVKILTKIYEWAKGKGWSETVIKIVLGALFGIIAAFCLTSCTLSYKTDDIDFSAGIITPIEYHK